MSIPHAAPLGLDSLWDRFPAERGSMSRSTPRYHPSAAAFGVHPPGCPLIQRAQDSILRRLHPKDLNRKKGTVNSVIRLPPSVFVSLRSLRSLRLIFLAA